MKKLAGGRALGAAALALTTIMSFGPIAHARGGVPDAPRLSGVSLVCSRGGAGNVVLNQSGKRITLAVTAQNVAPSAGWRVTVGDLASGVVATSSTGAVGTLWTSVINYSAVKGSHTVVVDATSLDGSNRCTAVLGYRV